MGRRLDALNAIAVEQGHTGNEPTSVVGAINAIVDAMGGNGGAVGIADAITALAPYIGGGGGGTTDVWLWNDIMHEGGNDVLPESIGYIKGFTEVDNNYTPVLEPLEFESVTEQIMGKTAYGVHVKDVPVGAVVVPTFGNGYVIGNFSIYYNSQAFPPDNVTGFGGASALKPIEGFVLSGAYTVERSA